MSLAILAASIISADQPEAIALIGAGVLAWLMLPWWRR